MNIKLIIILGFDFIMGQILSCCRRRPVQSNTPNVAIHTSICESQQALSLTSNPINDTQTSSLIRCSGQSCSGKSVSLVYFSILLSCYCPVSCVYIHKKRRLPIKERAKPTPLHPPLHCGCCFWAKHNITYSRYQNIMYEVFTGQSMAMKIFSCEIVSWSCIWGMAGGLTMKNFYLWNSKLLLEMYWSTYRFHSPLPLIDHAYH